MTTRDTRWEIAVITVCISLAALATLALGWVVQTVYLAFAPSDWPRPGYWIFVGVVVLLSAFSGGSRAGRRG